jgi:uncharacterized membrane protein (DUF106 family)
MMLMNRVFINPKKLLSWQEEIRKWNIEKERAKKSGDKKLLSKVKKQERHITQLESKILKRQLLNMAIVFVLIIGVWQFLALLYAMTPGVAYVPFWIPFLTPMPPYPLPMFFWYPICSYFSSTIFSRIFGVSLGLGMQPKRQATS